MSSLSTVLLPSLSPSSTLLLPSAHPQLLSHEPNTYSPTSKQYLSITPTNKPSTSIITNMAAVVLALGAAIYFTAEKIQDHREKKRALKAKNTPKHALLEDDSIAAVDGTITTQDLPTYHGEKLPAYDIVDQHQHQHQHQHPALMSDEQMAVGSSQRYYA